MGEAAPMKLVCVFLIGLAAVVGESSKGPPAKGEKDIIAITDAAIETIIHKTLDRRSEGHKHLTSQLAGLRKRFKKQLKHLRGDTNLKMKQSLERMNQAKESASKKKSEAILAADDELAQAMAVVHAHLGQAQAAAREKASASELTAQTALEEAVKNLQLEEEQKMNQEETAKSAAANKTQASYARAMEFATQVMSKRAKEVSEKNMPV